jgi:hypothetical protein
MTVTRRSVNYMVLGIAAVLAACSTQREPAKKAIDDISSTIEAESADADKYIPDQVASVDRKLTDLHASFDKKDYAAVLAGAPAVLSEAQGLAAATAARKDEIMKAQTTEWSALSASVPQLVASIKTRVNALSKSRHVPTGIDLTAGTSDYEDATVLWNKAQAAFASGNVEVAVAAASDAKAKADAAAMKLKLPGTAR